MNEAKEERILRQLKDIQEKQDETDEALQKHEYMTQHVHHLHQKSNELFQILEESWRDDPNFLPVIQQNRQDVKYEEKKLSKTLEHKRTTLTNHRQTLYEVENDLYKQHRILR